MKGKEQKKRYVKNNAEINWNTEYISEAYKYTIKKIAKIVSGWITDDFEYVPFIVLLCFR